MCKIWQGDESLAKVATFIRRKRILEWGRPQCREIRSRHHAVCEFEIFGEATLLLAMDSGLAAWQGQGHQQQQTVSGPAL